MGNTAIPLGKGTRLGDGDDGEERAEVEIASHLHGARRKAMLTRRSLRLRENQAHRLKARDVL